MVAIAAVFAAAMVWPALFVVGRWLIVAFAVAVAADAVTLYGAVRLSALRNCAERFSLGDNNDVEVAVKALVEKEVYTRNSPKNAKVVIAELGNDAGIIGAAFLGRANG